MTPEERTDVANLLLAGETQSAAIAVAELSSAGLPKVAARITALVKAGEWLYVYEWAKVIQECKSWNMKGEPYFDEWDVLARRLSARKENEENNDG